jgi:GT2 family glycosyltransferase
VSWPWVDGKTPPRRQVLGASMLESGPVGDHSGVSYGFFAEVARSWLRWRGRRPDGRGFVSGAAMLIDADSLRQLGGFDEQYFMYYEDIDLCLRANATGIATRIDSAWLVTHSRAHSTKERFAQSLEWSYESGTRFHVARGTPASLYRLYVTVDATLRWMAHAALRRDRTSALAYRSLASRSLRDLVRRRHLRQAPR